MDHVSPTFAPESDFWQFPTAEAHGYKARAAKGRGVKTQSLPKARKVTTLGSRHVFAAHKAVERR
jgi:hypothetical protein